MGRARGDHRLEPAARMMPGRYENQLWLTSAVCAANWQKQVGKMRWLSPSARLSAAGLAGGSVSGLHPHPLDGFAALGKPRWRELPGSRHRAWVQAFFSCRRLQTGQRTPEIWLPSPMPPGWPAKAQSIYMNWLCMVFSKINSQTAVLPPGTAKNIARN